MKLFLFFIYMLSEINFSWQYYDMKYGYFIMQYYNTRDCIGSALQEIKYSIEDQELLYFLNSASNIVSYSFSFDFFSTAIYYSKTEDELEEDDDTRRALLCNGLCYARQKDSDILVPYEVEFAPDYETESEKFKYYSCVYNNIIKNATIKLKKYSDKKCKTQIVDDSSVFFGNQSCWPFANYSYRPLYFEDDGKRLYYHLYNSHNDCTTDHYEYFDFNGYYFECDDKCYSDKNYQGVYYTCEFNTANNLNIIKMLYLYLMFFIIINL